MNTLPTEFKIDSDSLDNVNSTTIFFVLLLIVIFFLVVAFCTTIFKKNKNKNVFGTYALLSWMLVIITIIRNSFYESLGSYAFFVPAGLTLLFCCFTCFSLCCCGNDDNFDISLRCDKFSSKSRNVMTKVLCNLFVLVTLLTILSTILIVYVIKSYHLIAYLCYFLVVYSLILDYMILK